MRAASHTLLSNRLDECVCLSPTCAHAVGIVYNLILNAYDKEEDVRGGISRALQNMGQHQVQRILANSRGMLAVLLRHYARHLGCHVVERLVED